MRDVRRHRNVMPVLKKSQVLAMCLVTASASAAGPSALDKAVSALAYGDPAEYGYSLTDLNDDGEMDAVVLLRGSEWCGSGGCTLAVFQGTSKGFKIVSRSTISRAPIGVLAETRNGWHTLVVSVGGGGAKPGQTLLRFDGKRYPLNPPMQPYATSKDLLGASTLVLKE
jgi:hypothetical protein